MDTLGGGNFIYIYWNNVQDSRTASTDMIFI